MTGADPHPDAWQPHPAAADGVALVTDGHDVGVLWSAAEGDASVEEVARVLTRVRHPALPTLLDVVRDDGRAVAVVTAPPPPGAGVEGTADPAAVRDLCSLVAALDLAGASLTPRSPTPVVIRDGRARVTALGALCDHPRPDPLAAIRDLLPGALAAHRSPTDVLTAAAPAPQRMTPAAAPRPARGGATPRRGRALVAAALVIGGLALARTAPDEQHPPPAPAAITDAPAEAPAADPCPPPPPPDDPTTATADVDRDGCPDAVGWDPVTAVAHLHPAVGDPVSYAMGAPGDQLVLGDWDGDGLATPALYRPSTGVLATFEAWPGESGELTAATTDSGVAGGRAVTRAGSDGRDVVEVIPPVAG